METRQVEEFLSKIGVTSPSDKQSFRDMYNYVFDPIFKLPSFEQGSSSSSSPPNNNQPGGGATTEPEIKAFQLVLRKHFRFPTFLNLTVACEQAEAAFTKAVARRSRQLTADELKTFETKLRAQIQAQKKWVTELVDYRRRNKFHKSAREDAVDKFQAELLEKFDFDYSNKFYDEGDMTNFSKALEAKIVAEFLLEVNRKFRNKAEIHEWCVDLRKECSQRVTDAIRKSKRNEGDWNQKTEAAVAHFKELMEPFLKTHQYQFAKMEAVDTFRAKAKAQCEEKHGLSQFVTDPVLKSAWDAMVEQEYRSLVELGKAEGVRRMKSFLDAVKAEGQKAFKDNFNFELEGGELDKMFSQVPEIARLNLAKAAAESTTTPVEDKLDEIENKELGTRGGDDGSSISNHEECDIVESSSSRNTSQSFIIVSHFAHGNNEKRCTKYTRIFPANTRLPSAEFRGCSETVRANQTQASVTIWEDVSHPPAWPNVEQLGVIRCTNIPPAERGLILDYTMRMDAFGLLHVEWGLRGSSGRRETAQFKTWAWQGKDESDETSRQAHNCSASSSNNKRSNDSGGLPQEEVGGSSSKKVKKMCTRGIDD